MALTNSEEQRVSEIEDKVTKLGHLVQGASSKNMLNRLLTLCQEQIRDLKDKQTSIESRQTEILEKVNKLQ